MNVKLTDAQLVMLSAAAQRDDRCLTAPDTMKGAILAKVIEKLVKLGLARKVRARVGTSVWRRDDAGQSYALKLTAAGLKAIALDEGSQAAIATRTALRPKPRLHPDATNDPDPDIEGEHAKTERGRTAAGASTDGSGGAPRRFDRIWRSSGCRTAACTVLFRRHFHQPRH